MGRICWSGVHRQRRVTTTASRLFSLSVGKINVQYTVPVYFPYSHYAPIVIHASPTPWALLENPPCRTVCWSPGGLSSYICMQLVTQCRRHLHRTQIIFGYVFFSLAPLAPNRLCCDCASVFIPRTAERNTVKKIWFWKPLSGRSSGSWNTSLHSFSPLRLFRTTFY